MRKMAAKKKRAAKKTARKAAKRAAKRTARKSAKKPKNVISLEFAEKILDADFQNIVQKVSDGKPLTVAERTRVEAQAAGSTDGTVYAKNKVELAERLGVTRRTIEGWQKLEGCPKAKANSTYVVAEWREFVRRKGLKDSGPPEMREDAALKARKLLAEVEGKELELAVKKGEFISVEVVREEWTRLVGEATDILRAKFENELPPVLSGMDATGIQAECRGAIDDVLKVLHEG